MFEFFMINNLISWHKLGVRPNDLCIDQLLSKQLNICQSFGDGLQTRDIFLDYSIVLDKIWYEKFF